MDLKKAGCIKTWLFLFKKRRSSLALLFSGPYFGPNFFQGHKPTHVFKTRIVGADLLGEYEGKKEDVIGFSLLALTKVKCV